MFPRGQLLAPGLHAWALQRAQYDARALRCDVDADALGPLVTALGARGVVTLTSTPPTLEQLFLSHYAGSATEGARR